MRINDLILQNDQLAKGMKIYQEQIERLETLITLIRKTPEPNGNFNGRLTGPLQRKLDFERDHFKMLNEAYDEDTHKKAGECTSAFITEIGTSVKEIDEIFYRLTLSR